MGIVKEELVWHICQSPHDLCHARRTPLMISKTLARKTMVSATQNTRQRMTQACSVCRAVPFIFFDLLQFKLVAALQAL